MITNWDSVVEFKPILRDDLATHDLQIEVHNRCDSMHTNITKFNCITSEDIEAMIEDLKKVKKVIAEAEKNKVKESFK